jgi:hypothetical protein
MSTCMSVALAMLAPHICSLGQAARGEQAVGAGQGPQLYEIMNVESDFEGLYSGEVPLSLFCIFFTREINILK